MCCWGGALGSSGFLNEDCDSLAQIPVSLILIDSADSETRGQYLCIIGIVSCRSKGRKALEVAVASDHCTAWILYYRRGWSEWRCQLSSCIGWKACWDVQCGELCGSRSWGLPCCAISSSSPASVFISKLEKRMLIHFCKELGEPQVKRAMEMGSVIRDR